MGEQRHFLKTNSIYERIPVVDTYKYLGMWVNCKLTTDPQLEHIKDKVQFQAYKLWPMLKNISLDYRINLWTVLVRPMFEMLIGLYETEGKTNKEKIHRLIRKTFRKFTLIKKNVSNKVIFKLMDFDFEERVHKVMQITRTKWDARKNHMTPEYPPRDRTPKT